MASEFLSSLFAKQKKFSINGKANFLTEFSRELNFSMSLKVNVSSLKLDKDFVTL
jgi:hypothetical protein